MEVDLSEFSSVTRYRTIACSAGFDTKITRIFNCIRLEKYCDSSLEGGIGASDLLSHS